jgi:hypothetical protein
VITVATLPEAASCEPAIMAKICIFHEPPSTRLRGPARQRILRNGTGAVARHLRRKEKIHVRYLARHLD